MQDFSQQFIQLALEAEALRFGSFTLKSGRVSPYFFNAGQFNHGSHLAKLGYCYAAKIVETGIDFDLLFGPAYKGIPLVAVTAAALSTHFDIDIPYAFNRKEAKQHGEGGTFVGASPEGRVLVIDDVITAGTAIKEVVQLLDASTSASVCGVIVGLDRQEVLPEPGHNSGLSAVESLSQSLGVTIESIANLEHILSYLSNNPSNVSGTSSKLITEIKEYRKHYGCNES